MRFRARIAGWFYTVVMEMARGTADTGTGYEATENSNAPRLGPWGVYGEAIGNPKFYIGANPKDSEFLQADAEFAAAHGDLLRELAKH